MFFFFHGALRPQKLYGLLETGGRVGQGMRAQAHLSVHTALILSLPTVVVYGHCLMTLSLTTNETHYEMTLASGHLNARVILVVTV